MIEDSKKFVGVVDKDGNPLFSNASGASVGVNGDQFKLGGTRADLDRLCGADSARCRFEYKSDGSIDAGKPVKFIDNYQEFLQTEDGKKMLSAPFGGLQGGDRTWLFGAPYDKGGWVDKLVEAFAGPHDLIGGRLSGLYDAQGNATRGLNSSTTTALNAWSAVALVPAAPFAAAQGMPAPVGNAISLILKGAR